MKTSELLLRSVANENGKIPAVQFDEWLSQLVTAGFLETESNDDGFYYKLSDTAKQYLRKKGVEI